MRMWLLNVFGLVAGKSGEAFDPAMCDETNSAPAPFFPSEMSCSDLVQTLYFSRLKVVAETRGMAATMERDDFALADAQQAVSRAHALLMSQLHVASAVFQAKAGACLTEQLKFIFLAGVRKAQSVEDERWKFFFAPQGIELELARSFVSKVAEIFETETRALGVFLRMDIDPEISDLHFTHEHDGRLTTLEALRRATFGEDSVDVELVRNFQRVVGTIAVDSKIADFGAGSGKYAEMLRSVGNFALVDAFDATDDVDIVSRGKVRHANFLTPGIFVGNLYHWTLAIRVLDQLNDDAANFIKALDRHSLTGTVVTWSAPGTPNAVISPKTADQVIAIFESNTNFRFNVELTSKLKLNAALADELFVFTK